jgi:phosphoglucosamine mutase
LIAVDEEGVPANGDVVMAVVARHMKERGRLRNDTVVATVMSNLGFRKAMQNLGIELVETQVGDRYVLEAMRRIGSSLGGEQSGHVIFLDDHVTGDGLLTGVRLIEAVAASGRSLAELRREVIVEYPQVLRNVQVKDRDGLDGADGLWAAVAHAEHSLGGNGRVLVRASGTEPLIRVMVEAATKDQANTVATDLVEVVRAELG